MGSQQDDEGHTLHGKTLRPTGQAFRHSRLRLEPGRSDRRLRRVAARKAARAVLKDLFLVPVIVVGGGLLAAIAVVFLIVGTIYNVIEFVIRGHRPMLGGTCEVCGGLWQPLPSHRWQLIAYLKWLFQHNHSWRESPLADEAYDAVQR